VRRSYAAKINETISDGGDFSGKKYKRGCGEVRRILRLEGILSQAVVFMSVRLE
jgi:hypothetical protein